MRFTALIFLAFFLSCLPAAAQDTATPMLNAPSAGAVSEYKKIKDEYLEEAQRFFEQCETDYNLSQYYNCECLAVRYLDERVEFPRKNEQSILLSIRNSCHDATNAAGETYNSCMTNGTIFPPGVDPEAYCKCFASNYATLFEKAGRSPSSKTFTYLQSQAHKMCKRPVN